jgi:23S rRNA pseudouridine2605 synthase
MKERLQKIISGHGLASRREAEKLISEGLVKVNGKVAEIGDKADPEKDKIEVRGVLLSDPGDKVYIMLHKPRGFITTMSDELGRKTVAELVSDCPARVYPVGRLDYNSEGLLLMTNDGAVANALMHPKFEITKTYLVKVNGSDIDTSVAHLGEEMVVDGYKISPASIKILEKTGEEAKLSITIHEGRNRQIRKMCEQTNLVVKRLKRISEGKISLGDLRYGKWRYLSEAEIKYLQAL